MIDFYTKAVLTVIAISLLLMAVNPWINQTRFVYVDAPGVASAISHVSTALEALEPPRPVQKYRKYETPKYETPNVSAEDKAFFDTLPDKPKK
jgi:hypothetical protein